MNTWHIHIKGLVQGVGFRPHVCRIAREMKLSGDVSNMTNGVHIHINAEEETARDFFQRIVLREPPPNAQITACQMERVDSRRFHGFNIIRSSSGMAKADLLFTPDIAMCPNCASEIRDHQDRRYSYAFTTCLQCGPRYSIQESLPYDRENTTMHRLPVCPECKREYGDVSGRRHYSQTNSCPTCAIPMYYYDAPGSIAATDYILERVTEDLHNGRIIAVKGIGGYLLLCDATHEDAIRTLRIRKQRPFKPLAVVYPALDMAEAELEISPAEKQALQSNAAPIVLCRSKAPISICRNEIAPSLDRIGIMLPYTPLLQLIADALQHPFVATSGNLSGSPIIYRDCDALMHLFEVADRILVYDREIVLPQDDSVLQFSETGHRIIIRRSRGMAPNYIANPFRDVNMNILAMGADIKSAFAIHQGQNLYVSQYLGDLSVMESQEAYKHSLQHMLKLLGTEPELVITDRHPGYMSTALGEEIAQQFAVPLHQVQHHEAHFAAVMKENNLMDKQRVLGICWDGTGYGDDGNIWGSEAFLYDDGDIRRRLHLNYFPQLMGDKMSREPRLSALALLHNLPEYLPLIRKQFRDAEWKYYGQYLQQEHTVKSSSMGRFLDGCASLLGIASINSYEGEAAMKLEALARSARHRPSYYYQLPIVAGIIDHEPMITELVEDILRGYNKAWIAVKIFNGLAVLLDETASYCNAEHIAFSGGVFQNALLTDLVNEQMGTTKQLYFHRQLSPNDECIAFGQMAHYLKQADAGKTKKYSHVLSNTG